MTINYVKGDATAPKGEGPRFIIHCCNDIGLWGAGFVLAISRRWSEPENQYCAWHDLSLVHYASRLPLGGIQPVKVDKNLWVVNMIGQHGVGTRGSKEPPIRYDAIRACLSRVAVRALDTKYRGAYKSVAIHAPRFGAGLAGGDWNVIEKLIQEELVDKGLSVTVYDFDG